MFYEFLCFMVVPLDAFLFNKNNGLYIFTYYTFLA